VLPAWVSAVADGVSREATGKESALDRPPEELPHGSFVLGSLPDLRRASCHSWMPPSKQKNPPFYRRPDQGRSSNNILRVRPLWIGVGNTWNSDGVAQGCSEVRGPTLPLATTAYPGQPFCHLFSEGAAFLKLAHWVFVKIEGVSPIPNKRIHRSFGGLAGRSHIQRLSPQGG